MTGATHPAVVALKEALEARHPRRIERAVEGVNDALRSTVRSERDALACDAVGVLRSQRRYDELLVICELALALGVNEPRVHRQYAQALIERGALGAALAKLEEMRRAGAPSEALEVEGLLGRVHKQRYFDFGDGGPEARRSLAAALHHYRGAYERHGADALWQGINAVALLVEADRAGLARPRAREDAMRIANEIRAAIEAMENPSLWDYATLAEAHVALGNHREAAHWIEKYVHAPYGDAFEYASTWRQMREVWRLNPGDVTERQILRLLEANVLKKQGGQIRLDVREVASSSTDADLDVTGLQKVFGDDCYRTIEWFRDGLTRARGVARVRSRINRTLGTGFLVAGELLHESWRGRRLLVTNYHVVNSEGRLGSRRVGKPGDVKVVFEGVEGRPECGVSALLFESSFFPLDTRPPEGLDTSVLELDREIDVGVDFEAADAPPEKGDGVFVIGHAGGLELAFSFQDNRLIERDDTLLHYRSPTDPGSSGSPLFDEQWRLVGLHHAGREDLPSIADPSEEIEANEGFAWGALQRAVARALDGPP